MKHIFVIGAAALATISMPAAAQNLLSNGSFEAGAFAPAWTVSSNPASSGTGTNTNPVVITYGNPDGYPTGAFGEPILPNNVASLSPDMIGRYVAYFSSDSAVQSISQSITLAANTVYNFGFDYYAPQNGINNPTDASLSFQIDGVPVVGGTLVAGGNLSPATPARQWFNFNTAFNSGLGGNVTLSLQFVGLGAATNQAAADFAVDRVYATAAVPEPATWGMMIAGFGVVGGAMRRRRTVGKLATA